MFYYLLRELHFLSIDGVKVKQPVMDSLEFAQAVVKESTDLEVLRMHGRSTPMHVLKRHYCLLMPCALSFSIMQRFYLNFECWRYMIVLLDALFHKRYLTNFFQCTSQPQLIMLRK